MMRCLSVARAEGHTQATLVGTWTAVGLGINGNHSHHNTFYATGTFDPAGETTMTTSFGFGGPPKPPDIKLKRTITVAPATGELEVIHTYGGVPHRSIGQLAPAGDLFVSLDMDNDENVMGVEISIQEGMGHTTASLQGTYHSFGFDISYGAGGRHNQYFDTHRAQFLFDGSGGGVVMWTDLSIQSTFTYEVDDGGRFTLVLDEGGTSLKGAITMDGRLFNLADLDASDVYGLTTVALAIKEEPHEDVPKGAYLTFVYDEIEGSYLLAIAETEIGSEGAGAWQLRDAALFPWALGTFETTDGVFTFGLSYTEESEALIAAALDDHGTGTVFVTDARVLISTVHLDPDGWSLLVGIGRTTPPSIGDVTGAWITVGHEVSRDGQVWTRLHGGMTLADDGTGEITRGGEGDVRQVAAYVDETGKVRLVDEALGGTTGIGALVSDTGFAVLMERVASTGAWRYEIALRRGSGHTTAGLAALYTVYGVWASGGPAFNAVPTPQGRVEGELEINADGTGALRLNPGPNGVVSEHAVTVKIDDDGGLTLSAEGMSLVGGVTQDGALIGLSLDNPDDEDPIGGLLVAVRRL